MCQCWREERAHLVSYCSVAPFVFLMLICVTLIQYGPSNESPCVHGGGFCVTLGAVLSEAIASRRAGVSKVRPAGQWRPAVGFHTARDIGHIRAILGFSWTGSQSPARERRVQFRNLRIVFLLFVEDVVPCAPSVRDLQHVLGCPAAKCEVVGDWKNVNPDTMVEMGVSFPVMRNVHGKTLWSIIVLIHCRSKERSGGSGEGGTCKDTWAQTPNTNIRLLATATTSAPRSPCWHDAAPKHGGARPPVTTTSLASNSHKHWSGHTCCTKHSHANH